jgi:hypothetical protein
MHGRRYWNGMVEYVSVLFLVKLIVLGWTATTSAPRRAPAACTNLYRKSKSHRVNSLTESLSYFDIYNLFRDDQIIDAL